MNAIATAEQYAAADLVDIIDFKWLMAGEGHRVHIERMQQDEIYARRCLAVGVGSRIDALRTCACQLLARLERHSACCAEAHALGQAHVAPWGHDDPII